MYRHKECYSCAYWRYLSKHRPTNSIVIDNQLVVALYTETDPFTAILRKNQYIWLFRGELICANHVTNYGEVPKKFKRRFKQDGMFIDEKVYNKIKKRQDHVCMKKGCLDRYQCFFYHPEIAEPDGPWNKIPKWHKPGWEECPLFINKQTLKR